MNSEKMTWLAVAFAVGAALLLSTCKVPAEPIMADNPRHAAVRMATLILYASRCDANELSRPPSLRSRCQRCKLRCSSFSTSR
jgi:hypothetical protein